MRRLKSKIKPVTRTNILCAPVLSCRSPVLRRQAMLAGSCSQLETIVDSASQQRPCTPEFPGHHPIPSWPAGVPASSASPTPPSSATSEQCGGQGNGPPLPGQPLYFRQKTGRGERAGDGARRDIKGLLRLVRSHSEPGLSSSADTGTQVLILISGLFIWHQFTTKVSEESQSLKG